MTIIPEEARFPLAVLYFDHIGAVHPYYATSPTDIYEAYFNIVKQWGEMEFFVDPDDPSAAPFEVRSPITPEDRELINLSDDLVKALPDHFKTRVEKVRHKAEMFARFHREKQKHYALAMEAISFDSLAAYEEVVTRDVANSNLVALIGWKTSKFPHIKVRLTEFANQKY